MFRGTCGDTLPQGVPRPKGIGGAGDMFRKPEGIGTCPRNALIGAGVTGLALAEELSSHHESVFLVEFYYGSSGCYV